MIKNSRNHFSMNRDHLRCLRSLHAKFLFTNGFAAAILEQADELIKCQFGMANTKPKKHGMMLQELDTSHDLNFSEFQISQT